MDAPGCVLGILHAGWLSTLSFGSAAVDFAGSGVVHAVWGLVALAGAIMVGLDQPEHGVLAYPELTAGGGAVVAGGADGD